MKTRRIIRKIMAAFFSLLMLLNMLPMSAFAAGTTVDMTKTDATITINKLYAGSGIDQTAYDGLSSEEQNGYVGPASDGKYYKPVAGAGYTVYKIADFDLTQTSGTTSYVSSYPLVTNAKNQLIDQGDSTTTTVTSANQVTLASKLNPNDSSNPLTSAGTATTNASGQAVIGSLTPAVYLVIESTIPSGVVGANNFIVTVPTTETVSGETQWNYNVVCYPKNTEFDAGIDKTGTVADGISDSTSGSVSRGTEIDYTLTVDVPSDIASGDYKKFNIIDTPSTSLTIDEDSVKVYLNGTATSTPAGTLLTAYDISSAPTNYDYKISFTSGVMTIEFMENDGSGGYTNLAGLAGNDKIYVGYTAKVSANAPTGTVIKNSAVIDWETTTKIPGEEDKPKTEEEFDMYSYSVRKVDSNNTDLTGADFVLVRYFDASDNLVAAGTSGATLKYLAYESEADAIALGGTAGDAKGWYYTATKADAYIVTSTTQTANIGNGIAATGNTTAAYSLVYFEGLAGGTYYLEEVAAPSGYSLLANQIAITIDTASTQQISGMEVDNTGTLETVYFDGYSTMVVNAQGISLPSTGGIGIYYFIIGGVVLIGAALVLYRNSRKKTTNKTVE